MRVMWLPTVAGLITSSVAMSWLEAPPAISASTSFLARGEGCDPLDAGIERLAGVGAREEVIDLSQEAFPGGLVFEQDVVVAAERDELAVRDEPRQLSGAVKAAHGIAACVQDECGYSQLLGEARDVQVEKGLLPHPRSS